MNPINGIPITVTMVVAGLTLVIASRMELTRYQLAIALAAIPCFSGLLATWGLMIWESLHRNRRLSQDAQARSVELQIMSTWGASLSKLQTVISLSEARIELAQKELEETLQEGTTNIYATIRIGYKCVQTCRAVSQLCASGFPDQALALCRGLMEQEANLWFISTMENKEEVIQRYLDWEQAKYYRFVERRKGRLDARNTGPTKDEWDTWTKEYERLEAKYDGEGSLKNIEHWAVGTRANGSQRVEAYSIQERAWRSMPWLVSDERQLHDAWTWDWQRLNEFTHTTPRSIFESASSNRKDLVVTGQSPLGIDEPLTIAGRSALNISTRVTNIAASTALKGESRRSEELGDRTVKASMELLDELEAVSDEFTSRHL